MKDKHIKEIRENLVHTNYEMKKADVFDKIIKLSDFLKENNAYDEFVKNFDLSYYRKCTFSPVENVNFINAFSWLDNNADYWDDLIVKWDKLKYVSYDMDWLIHGKKYDMNWLFMEKN